MKKHLEYKDDKSAKFWEIIVSGKSMTIRWGKVGTAGQSKEKAFGTTVEAESEADKLTSQKVKKGYSESSESSASPSAKPKNKVKDEEELGGLYLESTPIRFNLPKIDDTRNEAGEEVHAKLKLASRMTPRVKTFLNKLDSVDDRNTVLELERPLSNLEAALLASHPCIALLSKITPPKRVPHSYKKFKKAIDPIRSHFFVEPPRSMIELWTFEKQLAACFESEIDDSWAPYQMEGAYGPLTTGGSSIFTEIGSNEEISFHPVWNYAMSSPWTGFLFDNQLGQFTVCAHCDTGYSLYDDVWGFYFSYMESYEINESLSVSVEGLDDVEELDVGKVAHLLSFFMLDDFLKTNEIERRPLSSKHEKRYERFHKYGFVNKKFVVGTLPYTELGYDLASNGSNEKLIQWVCDLAQHVGKGSTCFDELGYVKEPLDEIIKLVERGHKKHTLTKMGEIGTALEGLKACKANLRKAKKDNELMSECKATLILFAKYLHKFASEEFSHGRPALLLMIGFEFAKYEDINFLEMAYEAFRVVGKPYVHPLTIAATKEKYDFHLSQG